MGLIKTKEQFLAKSCLNCGNSFEPKWNNKKTNCCSIACGVEYSYRNKKRIEVKDGVGIVPLTQGLFAIIDESKIEAISKYNWHAIKARANNHYAYNKEIGALHRFIFGLSREDPRMIDHINHNGLDCRGENLRICTNAQNQHNRMKTNAKKSSKYKGVCFRKSTGKWMVLIQKESVQYYVGDYIKEIDAAIAYDAKAKELFGEFAYLNFSN